MGCVCVQLTFDRNNPSQFVHHLSPATLAGLPPLPPPSQYCWLRPPYQFTEDSLRRIEQVGALPCLQGGREAVWMGDGDNGVCRCARL